jgi:hypothetical protein
MPDVGMHTSDTREQRVFWFAANLQPRFVPAQKNQNRECHPQPSRNVSPPRFKKGHDLAPHPSNILNCVGRLPFIHRVINRAPGARGARFTAGSEPGRWLQNEHRAVRLKMNLRAMEIVYKMQYVCV